MAPIDRVAVPPARGRRPRRARTGSLPDAPARGSLTPGGPAGPGVIVRVLVAVLDAPLASRLSAYLSRDGEFLLAGNENGRSPPAEVVIVDYRPETGIPTIHGANIARPVALASACDDDALVGALHWGAWALLTDRPSPFEVAAVVRKVAAGECPILEQIARRPALAATALGRLRAAAFHRNPLTTREAAILAEVAKGAKNGVIGALFGLREQTVKNYLSEILRKTGAVNRAEAAALAVRRGWLLGGA